MDPASFRVFATFCGNMLTMNIFDRCSNTHQENSRTAILTGQIHWIQEISSLALHVNGTRFLRRDNELVLQRNHQPAP